MIISRSMHAEWRSNAWLVADRPGGHAVFIDAGAPIEPLLARVEELGVEVTHVLLTHEHHDHTLHMLPLEERFGATLVTPEAIEDGYEVRSGALVLRAIATPGHCDPHFAWTAQTDVAPLEVFTGDVLFQGTVGGTIGGGATGFADLRTSLLERLLTLPADTAVHPGHMESTTVGAELAGNPFVRAMRGELVAGTEQVEVAGSPATLILEGADYDGGTKAWVRFEDGRDAIVGGSMVTRIARETLA